MILFKINRLALMLILVLLFPLEAMALPQSVTEVKPDIPVRTRQVVLIAVDGLQANSLAAQVTPNINGLGMAGIMAGRVSAMPPDTSEARLFCLIGGAGFSPSNSSVAAKGQDKINLLSCLEKKGMKTALIDGTGCLEKIVQGVSYKCGGTFKNDGEVMEKALEVLKEKKPFFTVIVLSGPERERVMKGRTKEYNDALSAADSQVGKLLNWLHMSGTYEETLLVVAGTTGKPPLIIMGKDFLAGLRLPPVSLKDLPSTLGYLYGITLPGDRGLVLWNALQPGPDRTEGFMLQQRVKELSQSFADISDEAARLENEKIIVQQEKNRLALDKQRVEVEMARRDGKIQKLSSVISIMRAAGLLGLVIFAAALVVEYRVLKKRYLFFT